ncbi:16S rRNA (guanine(966)-N(2))-methyltransferase RsmD [Paenibacillus sp. SC116]|uniref:16S rRNA (guanine(966)-N(2))-methyltransferase RsmD n=1 Tax=Paenibacillus sp. SC116 TaxID=2968986 RepID=UPI00215A6AC0|nr:16S rRNA (guanine(966)-N(2))-methyltransferase RsmD [Paenibacillus sp. SC116]MCR8845396.1 16S rRNA (guanine(966)-N(2))-methyltransferase RsmD [Paenibacillus sp. SC116]
MRVISGTARGRSLKAVPGMNTRPTTDKVKEALFSMIGPYFDGGTALDLFAGTGGLGIEALSRGIDHAVFIDMDPKAIETIKHNVNAARVAEKAEIFRNDAKRALKAIAKRDMKFDLVFMDPPYRMTDADEMLTTMLEQEMLSEHAIVVIEHDSNYTYPEQIGSMDCFRNAKYGEIALSLYKKKQDELEERGEESSS